MKTYLVGGAVRDQRLGLPVTEKDWVVVGASPNQMTDLGFRQVGKDFPVFIHPESGDEYALARTERKAGHGYHGFDFNISRHVTLEQDLQRRDLTINAMAETEDGTLVDPWNGLADLKARRLRHVSAAFSEDPLRVLRVARFAARFHWLGFTVADDTLKLMQTIVESGEMAFLTPERVWKETSRALMEKHPSVYFTVLRQCGALRQILPEVDVLFGIPQPEKYHPEVDTGTHIMMGLDLAAQRQLPLPVRVALLLHDLGKGLTPAHQLPAHHGHEKSGVPLVRKVCERLHVPNDIKALALHVCEYHLHSHRALALKATTLHRLFKSLDVARKPARFALFVDACELDAQARTGHETQPYPQKDYLLTAAEHWRSVDIRPLVDQGLKGEHIGAAIDQLKLQALQQFKQQFNHSPHGA